MFNQLIKKLFFALSSEDILSPKSEFTERCVSDFIGLKLLIKNSIFMKYRAVIPFRGYYIKNKKKEKLSGLKKPLSIVFAFATKVRL